MAQPVFDSLLHLLSLSKLMRQSSLATCDPSEVEAFHELLAWALRVVPDLPSTSLAPSLFALLGYISFVRDEIVLARLLTHAIVIAVAKGLSYEDYIALALPSPLISSILEHASPTPRRPTGANKASPARKTPSRNSVSSQLITESGLSKGGREGTLFPAMFVGALARVLLHVLPISVARLAHSCEAIISYHSKSALPYQLCLQCLFYIVICHNRWSVCAISG